MITIRQAKYTEGYKIKVEFSDNRIGIADLKEMVLSNRLKIFSQLEQTALFKKFEIQNGTLCWGKRLDLAPEYLYFLCFRNELQLQNKFLEWGYLSKQTVKAASRKRTRIIRRFISKRALKMTRIGKHKHRSFLKRSHTS